MQLTGAEWGLQTPLSSSITPSIQRSSFLLAACRQGLVLCNGPGRPHKHHAPSGTPSRPRRCEPHHQVLQPGSARYGVDNPDERRDRSLWHSYASDRSSGMAAATTVSADTVASLECIQLHLRECRHGQRRGFRSIDRPFDPRRSLHDLGYRCNAARKIGTSSGAIAIPPARW